MNLTRSFTFCAVIAAFGLSSATALGQIKPRDLNTPRTFPEIETRAEWKDRAEEIREHILVSCGLWPMPPKTPLNAKIFDRVERDGYSIEKVSFETFPGFYLAGNLYRPLGQGAKRVPGVLNPHGHWNNGRLADTDLGSIAARCINFAKMGMVAFSYDMVGYNDTRQVDHKFASNPTNLLWNISLGGLQTWNSIRALDFLESLPDVDPKRLACTGESGGGTQTFMLGAIDDRLSVLGPIVMVSHSMQGGCLCENAPGLRVDYSNMEIAAVPAPKPKILVGATGDWTKKTMEVEGPAVESIYRLFGKTNQLRYTIFDYPHNYNRTSREAVYGWFSQWLLGRAGEVKELGYKKEADTDLLVFKNGLPEGSLNEAQFVERLVRLYQQQISDLSPIVTGNRSRWRSKMTPAWEHALQLPHVRFAAEDSREESGDTETALITREPDAVRVRLEIKKGRGPVALLIGQQPETRAELVKAGFTVVTTDACAAPFPEDQFKNYYSSYNRTWLQNGVANIKAATEYLERRFKRSKIVLVADRRSAGPAVFAAPLVDAVVADASGLNDSSDEALLQPNVFFPGLRRIGAFQGALELGNGRNLLHGDASKMQKDWLNPDTIRSEATPEEIARFAAELL